MRTDTMKPCPVCGADLARADAENVTRDRKLCPHVR